MTANQIQKDLSQHHMGMRRQKLLGYVREFKGQPPKAEQLKYTPETYARVKRMGFFGKQIAVYGTVHGESRRIQMIGSGKDLYNAMMDIARYPPKKRFLTVEAGNVRYYLDYWESWDEHPEISSR
jgi:hypothetical protein